MPLYFFDIEDGQRRNRDKDGTELADREEARREAIGVLPDIAREILPNGNDHQFICQVRDEHDEVIFVATLSLKAAWAGGEP